MATTMRSDELNIVRDETVVEKRNVLDIDTFFEEMYLTESEKQARIDLAKKIYAIIVALLTIIKANKMLNNEHDTGYYKDYLVDSLTPVYNEVFGENTYKSIIEHFSNEFIDSTMRHIDEPYFTSEDRATVNAENQSNAVHNRKQRDEAILSGKTKKVWVTMHDQRVRKTHVAADGQEVGINDLFSIGNSFLEFPCDPSGSPKETVNCRCTVVYK